MINPVDKLISQKITDYIPIEQHEPDNHIRFQKYPFISFIKIEENVYETPTGKIKKQKIEHRAKTAKDVRLENRYKLLKQNSSLLNNTNITKIDEEVTIEKTTPKEPVRITNKKHSSKKYNVDVNASLSSTLEYKPNVNLNKFLPKSTTLIVKNIPMYYSKNQLKKILTPMFSSFGDIKKLNFITESDKIIKDIAFLEYYNTSDAEKVLSSTERFIIDNSILDIEKSKK